MKHFAFITETAQKTFEILINAMALQLFVAFIANAGTTYYSTVNDVEWAWSNVNGHNTPAILGGGTASSPAATYFWVTDVVIPTAIGGLQVQKVNAYAFYNCSKITSVVIPDSVVVSSDHTFYGCSSLTYVTFPEGYGDIGDYMFYGCSKISSIEIPSNATCIGNSAFQNCSSIESLTIPDSVTSIGRYAFSGCTALRSLQLPLRFVGKTSSMSIPRGCGVTFHGFCNFTVTSEFGNPDPCVGTRSIEVYTPTSILCSISESEESLASGVRKKCIGWSGTGSVPTSGAGTNVTFEITKDSTLTWLWETQNLLRVSVTGGSCSFGEQWVADGTTATATIVPDTHLYSISLSGDTDGVTLSGTSLTIPSDRPREIAVTAEEVKVSLDVATAHGTATLTGRTEWSWGDTVTVSVAADAAVNGVRHVCTGWTGTGSVPANGTWTNVTFEIEEDSSITWNWRKENAIRVSVTSGGTCDFGEQWVADGTTATATIVPDTHLYSISLSGDTDGVTLSGTSLTIPSDRPREIAVTAEEVKVSLDVATAHGTATLTGRTEWSWGETVTASVVADSPVDGVRYVCTGWTGTGSVPKSGTGANATFTIKQDSTLTWNWRKENFIKVSVASGGTCSFGEQWVADGTTATATIVPDTHLYSISLSGDTDGVTLSGTSLTIPSDRPREIAVTAEEVKVSLDVATAHGTATLTGRTEWSWGETVDASVVSPVGSNGWQYVCTGWTGAGSVPANGTGTNVTFEIEEDSSITWLWETNVWVECAVFGDATAQSWQDWGRLGSLFSCPFTIGESNFNWVVSGDADGVVVDAAARMIEIPCDRPRVVEVRFVTAGNAVADDGDPLTWDAADNGWRPAFAEDASGGVCLRSGAIGANEVSTVETVVIGPGALSFDWRISAGRGNFARMCLDGVEQSSITRTTDWATEFVELDDGPHTLRWSYEKGTGAADGEDAAFLDNVRWTPFTLTDVLDATNLIWRTDGAAAWSPQVSVSRDGIDAARSGRVSGTAVSGLKTTLVGEGAFSWSWRLEMAPGGNAGVDVFLDGDWLEDYAPTGEWREESLEIEGEGEHTVRFEFWNAGTVATISDCAYLDQVVWTPEAPESIVVDGVEVPVSWLDEYPTLVEEHSGSHEAAANAIAANGVNTVAECYVAGLVPTNAADVFRAIISWKDGAPVITWEPDLNEGGTKHERVYAVEGRESLTQGSWGSTNANSHFFRVKVELK